LPRDPNVTRNETFRSFVPRALLFPPEIPFHLRPRRRPAGEIGRLTHVGLSANTNKDPIDASLPRASLSRSVALFIQRTAARLRGT